MTRLALNLSEYVNGVAERHAEVSRRLFLGYHVHAIINGGHRFTWTCAPFRALYDRHLPGWCHEPERLVRADCCLPDEGIWNAHSETKRALIEQVQHRTGVTLDLQRPVLGFARRMTAYKRADLRFTDMECLRTIAHQYPFQIVLAGKAHPRDEDGKRLIEWLHQHAWTLTDTLSITYLPEYDLDTARLLIAGADIWLNTPLRPLEASGTSGMKAAFNGVPSLSILDGGGSRVASRGGHRLGDRQSHRHGRPRCPRTVRQARANRSAAVP
ncbi:MAG TPA: alpha-glucan family phosphorylase [Alphaproteobacteria bacterium]|nr:alpha-glucan family phosphorylase [Alphaproteobacteria bacterium]